MKPIDCFLDAVEHMILSQKISEAETLKGILGANGFQSRHSEIAAGTAFPDYVSEDSGGGIIDLDYAGLPQELVS